MSPGSCRRASHVGVRWLRILAVAAAGWMGVATLGSVDHVRGQTGVTKKSFRMALSSSAGVRMSVPENWSVFVDADTESTLMLNVPESRQASPEAASADRLVVSSERRRSSDEAIGRLTQIAAETSPDIEIAYVAVGGWPALSRVYTDKIPKIGQEERQAGIWPDIKRVTVAVAVGTYVVRLEGTMVSNSETAAQEAVAIGRSMTFDTPGNAEATKAAIEKLQSTPRPKPAYAPAPSTGPSQNPMDGESAALFTPDEIAEPGLVRDLGNFSEIEVAASTSGRHIIVATNSRSYSVSNDGGVTFTPRAVNPAYPANGDPSLGVGQSGAFYFGFIAFPDNTGGAGNNIQACTTGITASTDNGTSFTHRGHATVCPFSGAGVCFPDQEHITADRFNPSATSQDMVYSAWRNFTPGGGNPNCNAIGSGSVQSQIRCSTDGGVNWGNTRNLAGDFPRVATGSDGFVYVVTRAFGGAGQINLYKFSSCGAGFNLQAGFPSVVTAGTTAVPCPMPGLDRCNDGNDLRSPTVAVDDTDPDHVFVAYATNTVAGNEDVVIQDSTNGGVNFGGAVVLNNGFNARRYMPWVCAVGGTAHVGWYDRRAASLVDNSLTDFFAGEATRSGGSLLAGPELRVSPTSDSNCNSGWCRPRSTNDSESCTQQPQLAGACGDGTAPESNRPCDFSDGCPLLGPNNTVETCMGGGGCPKYGDYNGIACQAGRIYAAYASATPPGGAQSQTIRSFLLTKIVCCVPQITVPGTLTFDDTCVGESAVEELNVCNTGKEDLEITSIVSSSPRYTVDAPTSGFPVVISPDFCFPFQVRFNPNAVGAVNATLTINNNDTVNPAQVVNVTGTAQPADVRVTGSTAFGDVCGGDQAEKTVSVCNVGACNLNVSSVAFSPPCDDFTLVNNPFPAPVSPDSCEDVVIRFTPTSCGEKSCTLVVNTNDPDNPQINLTVTANSPCSDIDVPPDLGFPPTALSSVGACTTALPFPVSNTGTCPLDITAFEITAGQDEYSISGLPSFPIILEPGHIAGEGDLDLVFGPDVLDRSRTGTVRVTYVSDPVAGTTTSVSRALCGEGVRTGARVLVTAGGVPLPQVEQIRLQRINANRNKNILDTVDNARNVTLQAVIPTAPCAPFQYHREYATVSNPIQLAPGSYQVTVTAIVNGKRQKKSVGFDVNTCGFNPTIVVNF